MSVTQPMDAQSFITSRVGNRVVQCPMELVAQSQRERQQESLASDTNALLADAKRIKNNALQIATTENGP